MVSISCKTRKTVKKKDVKKGGWWPRFETEEILGVEADLRAQEVTL